jgi:hypothetical protein
VCYVDKFLQEVKIKDTVMNPTILHVTEREDLLVSEMKEVKNNYLIADIIRYINTIA